MRSYNNPIIKVNTLNYIKIITVLFQGKYNYSVFFFFKFCYLKYNSNVGELFYYYPRLSKISGIMKISAILLKFNIFI